MSFGGSVQGMITSLKNNSNFIGRKIKYFDRKGNTKYLKKRTNFKIATSDQLDAIREKLKKEKRKIFYLNLIFFVIFILLLFYLLNLIF